MAYATAGQLRERYFVGPSRDDEFALRTDADLDAALAAASAEIDSYRQAGTPGAAALAILQDKCLILARMFAHQDQALDDAHPIVRDAKAVRSWLAMLAKGQVVLPPPGPDEGIDESIGASAAAPPRAMVYGTDFAASYSL